MTYQYGELFKQNTQHLMVMGIIDVLGVVLVKTLQGLLRCH